MSNSAPISAPTQNENKACPEGILVEIEARWLEEHSSMAAKRYAFAYSVNITNRGEVAATLVARHWCITDGQQQEEHVRGPGVVGYQPQLQPGQSFTYISGAILKTPMGTMHGKYLLVRPDGSQFESPIQPFALICPAFLQ